MPLADISDGQGLLDATLATMRLEGRGEPLETLAAALSETSALLILDNLEHIVESAAAPIAALLAHAPEVRLLATSRQPLRIDGERELDLGTLPVPPPTKTLELAELATVPSVGLFLDRARAALPDFALTPRNAGSIREICRTLDGLPLALEIAAGLVGAFSRASCARTWRTG